VDLLTPYKETATYGQNYTRPPPDLINEEEYEVECVINSRQHRCGHQVQYLVKWRGYPDSDNQWIKWQDVNAPDLIVEYQGENPDTITHIRRGWNRDESITTPPSSSLSAITDLITPHLTSMSNVPFTPSAFPGSTTQAQGYHLAFYETATTQVDDPTNGAAIIRRVVDLAQNTAIGRITEISKGTPDDSSGDAGMDADTNDGLNQDGSCLVGTNPQISICHAPTTTTTEEPYGKSITIPINVDALQPGSPESPIYINALKNPPSPSS